MTSIGVCAEGWQGERIVMKSKGKVLSTSPHMLKAMGAVALHMSTCKGGGKGGKHDKEKEGDVVVKAREVRGKCIMVCGGWSWIIRAGRHRHQRQHLRSENGYVSSPYTPLAIMILFVFYRRNREKPVKGKG